MAPPGWRTDLFAIGGTDRVSGAQTNRQIVMTRGETYKWQFRNHNSQRGQEVDDKISQVVVGIMRAEQKEHNRHTEQKLLRRGILVAVVDLLPHVEVIICPGIELEWNTPHIVEHDERSEHVAYVGESP